jgi:amino acid transporter
VNGVVGQGIFFIPAIAVSKVGPAALIALILGAVICLLISLCFAEVGSRFKGTGGAYLYAREAFGDFVGFEVGWMTCLVAMTAWAALANGLVNKALVPLLSQQWGVTLSPLELMLAPIILMTVLSVINLLGAKSGASLSTVLTVLKLAPISLLIIVGLPEVSSPNFSPFAPQGWSSLGEATLMLLYAYVGFETLVVPAGEMDNPKRSVPIALITVMSLVAIIYIAVFVVSIGVLPDVSQSKSPIADASAIVLGPIGGLMISYGILCSVLGTNAAAAMVSPRRIFAFAEGGHLPKVLAWIHPKTGAPSLAIITLLVGSSLLSLSGSFEELAVMSVVARFCQYMPTCLAAITLRSRGPAPFTLPGGVMIPVLTLVACVALLTNSDAHKLLFGLYALIAGAVVYGLRHIYQRRS